MSAQHDHSSNSGHSHGEGKLSDRQLIFAVAINVLLTLAQIVGGIVSGSLALIADAMHNFSDAAALGAVDPRNATFSINRNRVVRRAPVSLSSSRRTGLSTTSVCAPPEF